MKLGCKSGFKLKDSIESSNALALLKSKAKRATYALYRILS